MKFFVFISISFALFLASCCKTDEVYEDSQLLLPVKLISPNGIETYHYDGYNRLVGLQVTDSARAFDKDYTFIYQDNKMIKSVCSYVSNDENGGYAYSETYDFSYVNDDLIVSIFFEDNSGFYTHKTEKYKIDNKGNLKSGYGIEITYDLNGNISKIIDSDRIIEVVYDTHKGIYSNVNSAQAPLYALHNFGHFFRVNNPILITDSQIGISQISYEYNSDKYPSRITVLEPDFDLRIEELEYMFR